MNTQPPDRLQPPDGLRNEFLLVSIAYLLIVAAIGVFAPGVVDLLGRNGAQA